MANFAWQAFPEERELCKATFEQLNESQETFAAEFDPLVDLLDAQMEQSSWGHRENGNILIKPKELYDLLHAQAKERGTKSFPATVQGLSKWIRSRSTILKERYGYARISDGGCHASYSFKAPVPRADGKEIF